ncbi:dehydration-responsive element-binding protein 1d [Quercus suber]|uniref:Dehydration-responsive element-binding protein 1d n=1 Tax=Quercus suber TaxID=58331 RepID=A0AAW0KVN3_QUESU|nr:dehydration-responsive element-binding protein 1d [Quercus suber]
MREPNKKSRIWLETFPTVEMVACAYDVAMIALCGRSGCLNFADSVGHLPISASTTAKDIERATVELAKAFWQVKLD